MKEVVEAIVILVDLGEEPLNQGIEHAIAYGLCTPTFVCQPLYVSYSGHVHSFSIITSSHGISLPTESRSSHAPKSAPISTRRATQTGLASLDWR